MNDNELYEYGTLDISFDEIIEALHARDADVEVGVIAGDAFLTPAND